MVVHGRTPPAGEPVLDRALRLLDSFAETGESLALAELSRRADLPPSTALRLARKLTELGLLERPDGNRFTIGIRMMEIASRAPRGHAMGSVALPYMEELHRATGHYVMLGVRDRDEAVLIERLSPRGVSENFYPVGGRMPLGATGLGIVLLAFAPSRFQEDYLATPRVIEPEGMSVDVSALRRQLARVRATGIATNKRPVGPQYASVACPVFGHGDEPVAAISIVAPPQTLVPGAVTTALVAIAGVISRQLGGPGSRPR